MKKKILILPTSDISIGGIKQVILNHIRHLDSSKFEVDLVINFELNNNNVLLKDIQKAKVMIRHIHTRGCNYKYIKSLYKLCSNMEYDVVHIHGNSGTMGLESSIVSLSNKLTKVITHCHNTDTNSKLPHLLFKPLLNYYSSVSLAVSQKAGEWLYSGSFRVLSNSFEIDNYKFDETKRNQLREKYGFNNHFIIGHIGRFNNQKNQDFILELAKELITDNIIFLMIGEGSRRSIIERKIKLENLNNIVIFDEIEDISQLYSMMDLFVLPSYFEGLGLVSVEAQISGLPCLVSERVPAEIQISDNVKFLPIEQKAVEKWTFHIKKFKSTKRKNNIKEAKEHGYDISDTIKILEKIYLEEEKI